MRVWNSWRPTSVCVALSWLSSDPRSWSCSNASVWRWLFDDSDLQHFCLENYSQLPKIELRIVKDRLATKVAFLDSLLRYWSDWGWTNLPSRLRHTSSLHRHRYFRELITTTQLCFWTVASQSEAWRWRRRSCAWPAEAWKIFVASVRVVRSDFSCPVVADWPGSSDLTCACRFGYHLWPENIYR